jgi:hypothetical protein
MRTTKPEVLVTIAYGFRRLGEADAGREFCERAQEVYPGDS